jgi:hypothetical protein
MGRCIWVQVVSPGGGKKTYCAHSKLGRQCSSPIFLLTPPDEQDDELDQLTRQVNSVIETFISDHPGRDLRILADTATGDQEDQLRFAFVETDVEIVLPDPR